MQYLHESSHKKFYGQMVSKVCLKIKRKNSDINVVITNVDRSLSTDSESFVVDEDDILRYAKEYNEAYKDTYNWLISKNHMSTYDMHTHEIEKHTMISPICCTFRLPAEREMVALDINKAYTSNLMDMEKFPCFNAFDKYQVYDDHEIEDYTMYYIRALKSNDATAILFGSTYSRAYGYKLNRIDRKLFEILSFKRPSYKGQRSLHSLHPRYHQSHPWLDVPENFQSPRTSNEYRVPQD